MRNPVAGCPQGENELATPAPNPQPSWRKASPTTTPDPASRSQGPEKGGCRGQVTRGIIAPTVARRDSRIRDPGHGMDRLRLLPPRAPAPGVTLVTAGEPRPGPCFDQRRTADLGPARKERSSCRPGSRNAG